MLHSRIAGRCWTPVWFCMLALSIGHGCLRAGKSRAERDREVGSESVNGVVVDVADGHAAVVLLQADALVLWSGVPAFQFRLTRAADAPTELAVTVHNLMRGAELTLVNSESASVGEPDRLSATRATWQVRLPADETVELRVAPVDALERSGFEFALLNDVQEAIDGFHEMISQVNQEPHVRFVLGAGDLTSDGTRSELTRFKRELEVMRVPYYATLGNHELGVDPPVYHDMFGRGNYSFVFHDVRFTMLDSASAMLDPLVYGWLEEWLLAGQQQTHVVAMHIPPLDPSGTRHGAFANKNEAAKLLNQLAGGGVDLTLYGHIHTYIRFDNAGIEAHIAGGGGAIPNRGDGIGRHYLVVRAHPTRGIEQTRVVEVDSDWSYW